MDNKTNSEAGSVNILTLGAPMIFVLLWSTGFIGAKLGAPYAEPFTFLAIRFVLVLPLLLLLGWIFAKRGITWRGFLHSVVVGFFIHGIYLGGVFYAIDNGMSAGISALIVALQPIITVIIAVLVLGERLGRAKLFLLALAFCGTVLVLYPKLGANADQNGLTSGNLSFVFASAIAISVGSVYQKRFASNLNLHFSTASQYVGGLLFVIPLSLLFETQSITWSGEFIFALFWLIFVMSLGAVGLFMYLIRHNDISGTASLFFLVPAVAAIIAWFLFGEELGPIQLLGMVIVMTAVAMISRQGNAQKAT